MSACIRKVRAGCTGAVRAALHLGAIVLASWHSLGAAAPGDTVFVDPFNALSGWSAPVGSGTATVSTQAFQSAPTALRLADGAVELTSNAINAAVPAARLDIWVRPGQGGFTVPEVGEDLVLEYRRANNTWVELETFPGGGSAVLTGAYELPPDALHASLRLRLTMTSGSPCVFGFFCDYWYVDDIEITELAPPTPPLVPGACETFEYDLANWSGTDATRYGISAATASSPASSLFTRGGVVEVTSIPIDLSSALGARFDVWIRRGGSFSGSERPEGGDSLSVQYYTGSAWATLETISGGNPGGEVFDNSYVLPAAALHGNFRIRFRQNAGQTNGDYWHIDDVCVTLLAPVSYSFDEPSWTGAAGEVVDDSPYGLDGIAAGGATNDNATPARAGDLGTCRYGVFDGNNDFVEIADNPALDMSSEVTVSAWIRMRSVPPELHTIVSKDTNFEFHIDSSRHVYWWWNDTNGNARSITTTAQIALNTWYHVAITYESGAQRIYINGAVQGTTGSYTGTLAQNNAPLYVGTDLDFLARSFDGYIDEVRVIPRALSAAQVQALYTETHQCPDVGAQFTINHDGFGINCVAETIIVNVVDSNAGTPLLNYNADVRLDTQTGFGAWALVTGTGAFSDGAANDGLATYAWPLGQSQAVFALSYREGGSAAPFDVDVYQISDPGIRDNDAEPNLTFSPNGFTLTAAPLGTPPAPPIAPFATAQTAGAPFPIHLAAYGQTPDDPVCGIIEAYTGAKNLKFWSQYSNPASGTRNVQIAAGTTVDVAVNEAAAVAQNVVFFAGRASVQAKYKDVGQIHVFVKDDTTVDSSQLPSGVRGGTAGFVVRPYDFVLSDIRNAAGTLVNPQADDADDAVFVSAGSPFRSTVTARDAEGATTPNYGRESVAEGVRLDVQVHAPSAGADPQIGAAVGFGTFANGFATGTDFAWQEVGIIRLLPGVGDGDYLGAGDVTGVLSERVGRFVPSHFTVTLNAPQFATACTIGGFTYQGQPFGYAAAPVITAVARSASGAPTLNYTGAFVKLSAATLENVNYTSPAGDLDAAAAGAPLVVAGSPGTVTLTFASGTGLFFGKGTPQAPFTANIRLAVDVLDADGVAAVGAGPLGNPVTFGSPGGIAFSAGAEVRYGRIRLATATGSELLDLPVRMVAEHYAGDSAGFVVNGSDVCSTVALTLTGFTQNLSDGDTCVRDSGAPGASDVGCAVAAALPLRFAEPPAAGDYNLRLAAPGAGNSGSVIVSASVPEWLRYDWNAGVGLDEDPSAQATFGVFGGESRQIYMREIY